MVSRFDESLVLLKLGLSFDQVVLFGVNVGVGVGEPEDDACIDGEAFHHEAADSEGEAEPESGLLDVLLVLEVGRAETGTQFDIFLFEGDFVAETQGNSRSICLDLWSQPSSSMASCA